MDRAKKKTLITVLVLVTVAAALIVGIILTDPLYTSEEDISAMPVAYAESFTPKFNTVIGEALGIAMPEGYVALD